jgi:hypothetical protein
MRSLMGAVINTYTILVRKREMLFGRLCGLVPRGGPVADSCEQIYPWFEVSRAFHDLQLDDHCEVFIISH